MLLKVALRSIRKNLLMNFFILLEMIAAISLSSIMASSFLIRYRYYEPFSDKLEMKGFYCEHAGVFDKNFLSFQSDGSGILYEDSVLSELSGADTILSCNIVETFAGDNGMTLIFNYSYNDAVISRFTPELESGRFLLTSDKTTEIEAVITDDSTGYSVGDEVDIQFGLSSPVKVKIVGKLAENAKIFGGNTSHEKDDDYNVMYSSSEINNDFPSMLFSSECLDRYRQNGEKIYQGTHTAIICYPDDTDVIKIDEDQLKLNSFGCHTVPLDKMNRNSIEYLMKELFNLLPIITVILIMIFVSSISSTALSSYRHLREYAVYYIVGLRWKQCVYISLIRSCIISAASAILSAIILFAVSLFNSEITIIPSPLMLVAAAFVIISYILVSMIMPTVIFGKNTPKQILTR